MTSRRTGFFPGNMRRALITLVLAALIPVSLIQAWIYLGWFQSRLQNETQANLEYARAMAVTFREFVRDVSRQEGAFGAALVTLAPYEAEQADDLLARNVSEYSAIVSFDWMTPEGRIISSSEKRTIGLEVGDRDYFREILAGKEYVVSDLLISRSTHEEIFVVARGVRDSNGKLLGVAAAAVDPRKLGNNVIPTDRPEKGTILLFDHQGSTIYTRPEVAAGERDWTKIDPLLKGALEDREVTGSFISPVDGQNYISARVPVGDIGWVAGAGRPRAAVMAPLVQSLLFDLGLLVMVVVVSFLLAWLIGSVVTTALRRLKVHAQAIGMGNLDHRAEVAGITELVALSDDFNSMAGQLAERRDAEEKARTALLAANKGLETEVAVRKRAEDALREANDSLRFVLSSITDSYVVLDDRWRFVEINPVAERAIFRRPSSELVGKCIWDEYPQMVGGAFHVEYHKAVAEGRPVHFEARSAIVPKWFEVHAYPRNDRLEIYERDITERKQAEEALNEALLRLRWHIENTPLGVVEWDTEYRVTRWAGEAEKIFGWTAAEVVGKRMDEMKWVVEEDRGKVADLMVDMTTGTRPRNVSSNRNYRKDGSVIHTEWYNSAMLDASGRMVSVMSLVLDVTGRVEAEDALRRRGVELEASNRELEAFAYSVSHDLRAPLRSIDGFSQALMEDYAPGLDDQARDYLYRVRAASQRMGQLIDDLLKLSRVTRAPMTRQKVNLSGIAAAVIDELRKRDPERKVDVAIEEGLTAMGDEQLLYSAVENLVANAWKFTGKRADAKIEFGATREETGTVFFVRDNGAGFDMEYAGKLFAPFQRLHTNAEFPGTGVGLATVQRVIRRHGGRIWADGEVDKGAAFYFTVG